MKFVINKNFTALVNGHPVKFFTGNFSTENPATIKVLSGCQEATKIIASKKGTVKE